MKCDTLDLQKNGKWMDQSGNYEILWTNIVEEKIWNSNYRFLNVRLLHNYQNQRLKFY